MGWYNVPRPSVARGKCVSRWLVLCRPLTSFLQDCIKSVCDASAGLTYSKTTANVIHKLIFAYLNVRDRPRPSRFSNKEESQGTYDDDDVDWSAFDALAAGGEDEKARLRQSRDKETVEVGITFVIQIFSTSTRISALLARSCQIYTV